jgi:hypothetical protein
MALQHDINLDPPLGISRFDSSTAMLQALALHLHGRSFETLTGSRAMDRLLKIGNLLPATMRTAAYSMAALMEGAYRHQAAAIDAGGTASWACDLYPRRRYPAMCIGSTNGALMHLCAAAGIPWLPQTFLALVRQLGTDPNDPDEGCRRGFPIAESIARGNPSIAVHQMHDPNQDHLMLKSVAYFRLKFRTLPDAYVRFMRQYLAPGGTLYVSECRTTWPVTRTGPRTMFQVGGIGGATEDEYFHGGPRVSDFLARSGVKRERWPAPACDIRAPEAEWGFDPSLLDQIKDLARAQGWRVVRIPHDDPEQISPVAATIYQSWYREQLALAPDRLLFETFVMVEPHQALRLRAVPFWLIFNGMPSLRTAFSFLDEQPTDYPCIWLTLFSHGTDGVGLASAEDWRRLIGRAQIHGAFLGVDPLRYPSDFGSLARYQEALRKQDGQHPGPIPQMKLAYLDDQLMRSGRVSCIEELTANGSAGGKAIAPSGDVSAD